MINDSLKKAVQGKGKEFSENSYFVHRGMLYF